MPSIFLVFLILVQLDLNAGSSGCPRECTCRTRRVSKLGTTLFVNCKNRSLFKVPDLSVLKQNGLPKRLDLSGNRIRKIVKEDFQTGLNIAMLFLESNENIKLEGESFANLADSLQFLGLHSIHLEFDKTFTFLKGLKKLEKIILNNNSQKDDGFISGKLFKDLELTSLKEMSMYNCRISGMEDGLFEGIEHLQVLDLTFNWLKDIPAALRDLNGLHKVHLKLNNIKTVASGSFQGMTSLSEIDLNDNEGLNILNGSFAGLENTLSSLSIRNCDLDDVSYEGIHSLRALKHLRVGYNPLVSLSSKSLEGGYCLETLDISKTLFPLRPEILQPQKDCIITIIINDRGLTEIPKEFLSILTRLNFVSINRNKISVLKTDSLTGIKARGYDFADNPLVKIEPGVFKDVQPGITLTLKRTNITNLHFMLDYPQKTFQHVYLEGLNVTCDCSVYEASRLGEPWTLNGRCFLKGDEKDLKEKDFKQFLKENCTDPTDESQYSVQENVQESVKEKDASGGCWHKHSIDVVITEFLTLFLVQL